MSLCQDPVKHLVSGEVVKRRRVFQHLRDVEELRFDFVLLDHLMF